MSKSKVSRCSPRAGRDAAGRFLPGPCPDRHQFTPQEQRKGGRRGFQSIMERKPWLLPWLDRLLRREGRRCVDRGELLADDRLPF